MGDSSLSSFFNFLLVMGLIVGPISGEGLFFKDWIKEKVVVDEGEGKIEISLTDKELDLLTSNTDISDVVSEEKEDAQYTDPVNASLSCYYQEGDKILNRCEDD